jgi:curved DNA-binding protein
LLFAAGCSRQPEERPASAAPAQPTDGEAEIVLTAAQAKAGAEAQVTIPETRRTVTVTVPPGVADGARLRLKGMALPGADGAPRDFVIRIRVQ